MLYETIIGAKMFRFIYTWCVLSCVFHFRFKCWNRFTVSLLATDGKTHITKRCLCIWRGASRALDRAKSRGLKPRTEWPKSGPTGKILTFLMISRKIWRSVFHTKIKWLNNVRRISGETHIEWPEEVADADRSRDEPDFIYNGVHNHVRELGITLRPSWQWGETTDGQMCQRASADTVHELERLEHGFA